jgi:hypothetical protein
VVWEGLRWGKHPAAPIPIAVRLDGAGAARGGRVQNHFLDGVAVGEDEGGVYGPDVGAGTGGA